MTSRTGFLAAATRFLLVIALIGVAAAGALFVADWRPSLNPFKEKTVDRTGPSVLQSLNDLSEFRAASGYYETVVDLEDDTSFIPDFLSGERVIYVAKGNVDVVVDFEELDERRVTVSEADRSVMVELPTPAIADPVIDLEDSYVADYDRGLTDRFRGSDLERRAQLAALDKMTEAASGQVALIDLAKDNTDAMLRGLLGALGYSKVTITFEAETAADTD